MKKIKERINTDAVAVFVLAFAIVLGNFINVGDIRLFGVVLTLYRVIIPMTTIGFLFIAFKKYKMSYFKQESKLLLVFFGVMIFWMSYGAVMLFVSPYSDFHAGLKELLALFLGMCSVYCIKEMCGTPKAMNYFLNSLKIICVGLFIFAMFEHLTNLHLETSKLYTDIDYEKAGISKFAWLKLSRIYLSSTFFYNVNDFCALLGVLLPLFFYNPKETYKYNLVNTFCFLVGVFILSVNDATIVLTGVVFSYACYVVLVRKHVIQMGAVLGATAFTNLYGTNLMVSAIKKIKLFFALKSGGNTDTPIDSVDGFAAGVEEATTVEAALISQVIRAQGGRGSLYTRIALWMDSWDLFVKTKGLGIGPAGFVPYFEKNEARTIIISPHNWWLEILSQYGIFVFVAYVGFIVYEFTKMIKLYIRNKNPQYAIVIAMCVSFVVASIAPSSFLGYSYQWILPGICMCMIDNKKTI